MNPSDTHGALHEMAPLVEGRSNGGVLRLNRDVTLTLFPNALIMTVGLPLLNDDTAASCPIVGRKAMAWPSGARACSQATGRLKSFSIRLHHILWANVVDDLLNIAFANEVDKNTVQPGMLSLYLDENANEDDVSDWIDRLMRCAYGRAQRQKRVMVLINPFGGRSNAVQIYETQVRAILHAAHCDVKVQRTEYREHAAEIAAQLDVGAFDVVACVSGDGVPHEVFNGLGRRPDARRALAQIAVAQLPAGTGNAMSLNLNGTDSPSLAAVALVKGVRTPLDLVSITQASRPRTLSFLSQALGIVADVDLGTENLRWMGDARNTVGFLTRVLKRKTYPCDVAVRVEHDRKQDIRERWQRQDEEGRSSMDERRQRMNAPPSPRLGPGSDLPPLQYGTVSDPLPEDWVRTTHPKLGNLYCGNMVYMANDMPFFPAARPHDGCMDLVTIENDIGVYKSVNMFAQMPKGAIFDHPGAKYRKISAFRVMPVGRKGYVAIDGEGFDYAPFQGEIHHGLGTVLSKSGHAYEARGFSA